MDDKKITPFQKVAEKSAIPLEKEEGIIKVEVILEGWYDRKRVSPGAILEVPAHLFSKRWMKKI